MKRQSSTPHRVDGLGRRSALVAGIGALAGCTGVLPDVDQSHQLEPGEGRGIEVTATREIDPSIDGTYEVTVTRDEIARSAPALLRISFTNDGSEARGFEFGPRPPFSTIYPTDSLQYHLVDGRTFDSPLACYEPNEGGDEPIELDGDGPTVELDAGEEISILLELWGSHLTDDCLPEGSYTYGTTATVEGGPKFAWSFDLEITEIEVDPTS